MMAQGHNNGKAGTKGPHVVSVGGNLARMTELHHATAFTSKSMRSAIAVAGGAMV